VIEETMSRGHPSGRHRADGKAFDLQESGKPGLFDDLNQNFFAL
jgi:hypothetical protein